MPPIAQRLREPAAFVLLAFGAISTLFNTITFLFGPGEGGSNGVAGPTFSERGAAEVERLLDPVVIAGLVGAVILAHLSSHVKNAKIISLAALIGLGVADLFGVVALFSAFGADVTVGSFGASNSGWDKATVFFIGLGELAVAGVGSWLVLGYFQQHQPAKPVGGFQQPQQQWGPGPQQPQPQQQPWQQQPPQQAPQAPQQPWGPPPQQQAPQAPQTQQQPPQPQWGQPQPQQDADSMMTQAIPTVPPAPQGQQQPPQPPQQDGGLPIGNWTAE